MERLLLVRCPELLVEDDGGDVLRRFARVVEVVRVVSPWVTVVRAGVCTVPARGPARFFGGVDAVVRLVGADVAAVDGGTGVEIGVAEGVFAAHLAARAATVVAPGGTAAFLAGWPLEVLDHPELAQLLRRLGLRTVGDFAALPERHVLARLGADGVVRHRLARAVHGELPGFRQPAVTARMTGTARTTGTGRMAGTARTTGTGATDDHPQQAGFWGGRRHADDRAARALAAVQALLGPRGVLVPRCQGGRSPTDRARFTTWAGPARPPAAPSGRARAGTGDTTGTADAGPWPGRIPPPAPALVHRRPEPVTLVAADGAPLSVTGRGALTAPPDRLRVAGGPWTTVRAWAGPWPTWERWWTTAQQREARLQVVTGARSAHLLAAQHDGWWLLATYD